MRILVTNDDGVLADGLRVLVTELSKIARVMVVAPDRERSVIGTAVSLRRPLKVHGLAPIAPGVETYAVEEGTPSDSVVLALGKLARDNIDLVISGINQGPNLGDDVLISGTVSAALQGYEHGLPALALSACAIDERTFLTTARLAALLSKRIEAKTLPSRIFLNVNVPALPLAEVKGTMVTRVASGSHNFTVDDECNENGQFYRLRYQRNSNHTTRDTDIWAIELGNISISPLHIHFLGETAPAITGSMFSDLLPELQQY